MSLSGFGWWHSTHHIGAILYCLLTVEGTLKYIINIIRLYYCLLQTVGHRNEVKNFYLQLHRVIASSNPSHLFSSEALANKFSMLSNCQIWSGLCVHSADTMSAYWNWCNTEVSLQWRIKEEWIMDECYFLQETPTTIYIKELSKYTDVLSLLILYDWLYLQVQHLSNTQ